MNQKWIQLLKLKTQQRGLILIGDLVDSTGKYSNHYFVFKRKPIFPLQKQQSKHKKHNTPSKRNQG